MQTWPSPGTPGAPTYWPSTERVGFFDTPAVDHDHIIAGTYHDGTGRREADLHRRALVLDVAPLQRQLRGAVPAGVLQLAVLQRQRRRQARPDATRRRTYPQNGTGPLSVSIVNTGGSVATNVDNVSLTLAPGFTYVATTSGPAPIVSGPDADVARRPRRHRRRRDRGDDPGGGRLVGVGHRSARSSSARSTRRTATSSARASPPTSAATSRSSPVPAPTLTKTPSTQGPVTTGSTVTWTLDLREHRRRAAAQRRPRRTRCRPASRTSRAPRRRRSPRRR